MSVKINFKGIKKFEKALDDQINKVNTLGKKIPFEDLFNERFMNRYTNFKNIDSFVEESNFDFNDIESIDEFDLNEFVKNNTIFSDWNAMKNKAAEIWVSDQLSL